MTRINRGAINHNTLTYTKNCVFSKAVLWKDRQLSVLLPIMEQIVDGGITLMKFVDRTKKEIWEFQTKKVTETMEIKKVGQETQCYFPIGLAKKIDFSKPPEPPKPPEVKILQTAFDIY